MLSYLRQAVALRKTSEETLVLSMLDVNGSITFSVSAGRAVRRRSGLMLSAEDRFHRRPVHTHTNKTFQL